MVREFEVKQDQKRLSTLLDVPNMTYGVTMLSFDEEDQEWIVTFKDQSSLNAWAHLTNWVGFPVKKSIANFIAL